MNTSYRSIWNHALGAWVAVSEVARARGKRTSSTVVTVALVLAAGGAAAQDHVYTTAADAGPRVTSPAGADPLGITLTTGAGIAATQSSLVSGALGVIKAGVGTLTLTGANTYEGGTFLRGGILQVSQDANLGAAAGGLVFDGGTLRLGQNGFTSSRALSGTGGTLDVAGTESNVFHGAIGLTGPLSLINSAAAVGGEPTRLVFTSSNNTGFTGGTTIGMAGGVGSPGRLNVDVTGTGTLGTGTVDIFHNAGLGFTGAAASAAGLKITVHESSEVLGTNSGVAFTNGATAGNATITLDRPGAYVAFNDAGTSMGASTITNNGGRVYVQQTTSGGSSTLHNHDGIVSLDQLADLSGARIDNHGVGDIRIAFSDNGVAIGELSGDGIVTLGGKALTLGALNTNATFSGVIADTGKAWTHPNGDTYSAAVSATGGKLIKVGTGTLTLSGANTYQGGTYLNAGTLQIGADANLGAASGGLSFNGGTLAFSSAAGLASARALTVQAGGATFDAVGSKANTFSGTLSGTGPLTFLNSAPYVPGNEDVRFTLSSSNNTGFTGPTQVGTVGGVGAPGRTNLVVTGSGTLGSGPVDLYRNAEIRFSGPAASANALAITVHESSNELGSNSGIDFAAGAKAGSATLTTQGAGAYVTFNGDASADQATIVSHGGRVRFNDTASGGSARISTVGGLVSLAGSGDMSGASVVSDGGSLVVAYSSGGVSLGDLSGSGTVVLGAQALTLGALNQSSTLSGVISDTGPQWSDKNGTSFSDAVTATGGKLIKIGTGTLTLTGANTYSGGTDLTKGRLDVGHDSALGSGDLAMNEGTTLGFVTDGLTLANNILLTGITDPIIDTGAFTETLAGAITGGGILTKTGSGTLVVSGANSYTGATQVDQGTFKAGAVNSFSSASAHTVAAGATLDTAGFNQSLASLTNSGTVSLVGTAPGSTLTVNGAYVGNNGVLKLGTFLGDSTSASDRLVLNGPTASASGNTSIQITQVGGLGALTTGNGINVVSAENGATTAANAFSLAGGHVDAGAFEYRLHDGDASGAGENWYLRSTANVVPPVIPPVVPVDPVNPVTPPVTPPVTRPTYRAEVPLYSALPSVLRQGDLAMLSTLHRRVGDEAKVANADAPAIPNSTRAWGRLIGGNTTITQNGTTAPESRTSIGGFQTGVDLFANAEWNAGLYVGKLRSDADVRGVYGLNLGSSYAGSLRADTTYLGGYATYANANGLYVDTVLQYGIQDITGTSVNRVGAIADGKSLTASVEVGQRFQMGANWAIEPQAQLIYNRQNLGNSWIGGLTSVEQDTANAVIGRLGVRVTGDFSTGIGRIQPYARVNLWHGFKGTDSTSFLSPAGATRFDNQIGYTSVEVAAGATWALTPTTSVYGELGSLMKAGGQAKVKSSVQGSVGVKLRF